MTEVSVLEAKNQLSHLLELVASGEEVVIKENGRRVARLIPESSGKKPSPFGAMRNEFVLPEGWDRPLTDVEADEFWEGR